MTRKEKVAVINNPLQQGIVGESYRSFATQKERQMEVDRQKGRQIEVHLSVLRFSLYLSLCGTLLP